MSPKVVKEWTDTFDRLLAIELEVRSATGVLGLSPLEVVKAAVRIRRAHASLTSYESSHELWDLLPERVLQLLSGMILGTVNFHDYTDILVAENPTTSISSNFAQYYLHLAQLADPLVSNAPYLAETPATVRRLLALNDDPTELRSTMDRWPVLFFIQLE
jgi:hypothetical protein